MLLVKNGQIWSKGCALSQAIFQLVSRPRRLRYCVGASEKGVEGNGYLSAFVLGRKYFLQVLSNLHAALPGYLIYCQDDYFNLIKMTPT